MVKYLPRFLEASDQRMTELRVVDADGNLIENVFKVDLKHMELYRYVTTTKTDLIEKDGAIELEERTVLVTLPDGRPATEIIQVPFALRMADGTDPAEVFGVEE